ncbi:MAG: NAD+ synthetase, partial [Sphingobacteriia bacterium]
AIERAAWVEGLPPLQVYQSLLGGSWTEQQLRQGIVRFFRLWSRNQWKRERYAPGFHLDSHNLDPRSWYRHPILSGGWEQELRELEEV